MGKWQLGRFLYDDSSSDLYEVPPVSQTTHQGPYWYHQNATKKLKETLCVMILFPHFSTLLFICSFCLHTWRGRGQSHFLNSSYLLLCRLCNQISSSAHSSVVCRHIEFLGLLEGWQWVKARRSWAPTVIRGVSSFERWLQKWQVLVRLKSSSCWRRAAALEGQSCSHQSQ